MSEHELISVFTTRDAMRAQMIQMALQEQDIPAEVENLHQAALTGVLEVKVNVRAADADQAKQIIRDLESPPECKLVVMTLDDESGADEVQLALKKLERSYLIDLKDSVVIVKDVSGEISLKQAHNLTQNGALAGGLCGALLGVMFLNPALGVVAGTAGGAAVGALTDFGIDDDFLRAVGDELRSASSALAVLVRRADPEKVLAELAKFEGKVLQTTLAEGDEERLRAALERHA